MPDHDRLAEQFELSRPRLRKVAYRMLGSHAEADDAVQEAWIRLSRTESDEVESLPAWLTTVVSRICLNVLRARGNRAENLVGLRLPDPVIEHEQASNPEDEAILSDSVGLALLIVLDTLSPAERIVFVLHDTFHLTFDEIGTVIGRSTVATRQVASRARRRVQGARTGSVNGDFASRRLLVDAFYAAARGGDLDALVALLDPDVELRADGGRVLASASAVVRGALSTAQRAALFRQPGITVYSVLVNGTPGALVEREGKPVSVMGFTIEQNRIVQIQILLDPDRLASIDFAAFRA